LVARHLRPVHFLGQLVTLLGQLGHLGLGEVRGRVHRGGGGAGGGGSEGVAQRCKEKGRWGEGGGEGCVSAAILTLCGCSHAQADEQVGQTTSASCQTAEFTCYSASCLLTSAASSFVASSWLLSVM
jgi:hypothetical protein